MTQTFRSEGLGSNHSHELEVENQPYKNCSPTPSHAKTRKKILLAERTKKT